MIQEPKQVFISYSSKDEQNALEIRNVLERKGFSCWMGNRDIPGGANYTEEITEAIRKCQAFILLLSKNAQNSLYVLSELECARSEKKVIIPIMLEDFAVDAKFEFHLRNNQKVYAYDDLKNSLENISVRLNEILCCSYSGDATDNSSVISNMANSQYSEDIKEIEEYIRCPRCNCSHLRQTNSDADKMYELAKNWMFGGISLLIYVIAVVCMLVHSFERPMLIKVLYLTVAEVVICMVGIIHWIVIIVLPAAKDLVLIDRGLQLWKFRCMHCGKRFIYQASLLERIERRVETLQTTTKKSILFRRFYRMIERNLDY